MVSFAKPEDLTQLVAFGYKSFEENKLKDNIVSPDFDKTVTYFHNWILNDVVLVERNKDDDKYIDGCAAFAYRTPWWSNEMCLHLTLLYVLPEKRSFSTVRKLLKEAKEYAIINRIPLVLDLFGNDKMTKKAKLLEYLGFNKIGSLFVFQPPKETETEPKEMD